MRVAAIAGERQGGLVERPDPVPGGEFAVIEVRVTPMCTEYKAYAAGRASDRLGHEAMGHVLAVDRTARVRPGDRVVVMPLYPCGRCFLCVSGDYIHCSGMLDPLTATGSGAGSATYAERLLKQDWLLLPVPDDLSDDHAAMACCALGPTFGAMERLQVNAFDTVLITGLGPVGLGGVINAVARGARVLGVESHPYRAALASELGAEQVFHPGDPETPARIRDHTAGPGPDCGVDCSGAPEGQRLLVDAVRRRGRVAFVGEGGELTLHVSNDLLRKGLEVHGIWHWNLRDAPRMWEIIRRTGPLLDRLITHRFPLERVVDAWELQLTGACGKILLYPGGGA